MVSTFSISIQHTIESSSHSGQKRKRIKGIHNRKEVKLSLFSDNMIATIENTINSTKNTTWPNKWIWQSKEIQSIFRNQRHFCTPPTKYWTQKSRKIATCYSDKKNKVPKNKPAKEVKDMYSENYTTLKKLRKTQINGSMYHAHGLEELTPSKCSDYPKQFIHSMQSLLKY